MIVTIDGVVKAMRTALKMDTNKEPLVMGQVVIEFPVDTAGQEVIRDLVRLLDSPIRAQLTDAQLDLPRTAAK